MDEVKLHRQVQRQRAAEELLENPLLVEAFEYMETRLLAEWKARPLSDTDGRERDWIMLRLLGSLKGHIRQVVQSGMVAEKNLANIAEQKKRKFRILP